MTSTGYRGTLRPRTDSANCIGAGRITDADLDAGAEPVDIRASSRAAPLRFGDRDVSPVEVIRGRPAVRNGHAAARAPLPKPRRALRPGGGRHHRRAGRQVVLGILRRRKLVDAGPQSRLLRRPGAPWRRPTRPCPASPGAAARRCRTTLTTLCCKHSALGVDEASRVAYLQAHLSRLPGWAAHIQWCAGREVGVDLPGYLAMRLSYEGALLPEDHLRAEPEPPSAQIPSARERAAHLARVWNVKEVADDALAAAARVLTAIPVAAREMLWQNAFEAHYRDQLLAELAAAPQRPPVRAVPDTQLVSCIDTRSEGLRRHLESHRRLPDLGFAGFFAVAIRFTDLLGGNSSDLCPVLIEPSHDIARDACPRARARPSGPRGGWCGGTHRCRSRRSTPPKTLSRRRSRSRRRPAGWPRRWRRSRRWRQRSAARCAAAARPGGPARADRAKRRRDCRWTERVLFARSR